MRQVRLLLWVLVALAIVGAGVALVWKPRISEPQPSPVATVDLGGPFTLTGTDGQTFPSSKLAGTPFAIFFGFTHCPDVCPTTLARLVRLRRAVGKDLPFAIVFVTVDPERDKPSELADYLTLFPDPVVGLTGTPSQIALVKRQFGIFSEKVPDQAGGYTVDHTATVLLFGRNGKFVATIAPEESDGIALEKLNRIAR